MNVTFETKYKNKAGKDEWLTPPEIIKALGGFDLDPCSPINRPWSTANKHFTIEDDGLIQDWNGRVWCNPPYGDAAKLWLNKCADYGNAIALTFARTETRMFFDFVWSKADAVLFIKGRLKFYHITGVKGDSAGAPSVLIAYGKENAIILENCGIPGKFINLTTNK
ncbi:adenine methyltransferase [Elizabethkingia anophelis]|nr:adenine methyltransferase [Elizabethkingia anophelis]MDV3749760.1 adenine methyltransferase [Elizabethkingia anophelis]